MRQIEETTKLKLILATIALLVTMITPAVLPHVSAQPTSFSFNLITPNASKASSTDQPILQDSTAQLTGQGTFDTFLNTVSGGGSYTGFNPKGSIDERGTWTATNFVSFKPYGGPNPGSQGGLLLVKASITVTSEASGTTMTLTGITVQISCRINAPSVAPEEGTTLPGRFSQAISGLTEFHENI